MIESQKPYCSFGRPSKKSSTCWDWGVWGWCDELSTCIIERLKTDFYVSDDAVFKHIVSVCEGRIVDHCAVVFMPRVGQGVRQTELISPELRVYRHVSALTLCLCMIEYREWELLCPLFHSCRTIVVLGVLKLENVAVGS